MAKLICNHSEGSFPSVHQLEQHKCFVKINISAKNPLQVMQQCHVALFTVPYCTGRWCSCCRQLVWRTSQCKRTGDDGSASRKRAEDPMRTSPFLTSYVSLCYKITSYIFSLCYKIPSYIFSLCNKMTDLSKINGIRCYPCSCWISCWKGFDNLVNKRWKWDYPMTSNLDGLHQRSIVYTIYCRFVRKFSLNVGCLSETWSDCNYSFNPMFGRF